MNWTHICSQEWMKERQKYLCASEMASIAKAFMRSTPNGLRAMGKLKAKKAQDVEPDPVSWNDAAKGHLLEPYAVKSFNDYADTADVMFHYDDIIVHDGCIGWSPDAMNCILPDNSVVSVNASDIDPTACLEIKSYGPEHYYECARIEDKFKLDERWQVATAMYLCKTMRTAYLMFYCPEIHEATLFTFSRQDLESEINIIKELSDKWNDVDIWEIPSSRQTWKVEEGLDDIWKEVNC